MMKLAIAICSARDWKPHFGVTLAGLIGHVSSQGIKNTKLEQFDLIIRSNCSNICNGRHSVIDEAIERGFTHILMLDDDHTFPVDILDRLCAHKKQAVGLNFPSKSFGSSGHAITADGKHVKGPGLREVVAAGLGLFLIELEPLKTIPKPWFEMRWIPGHRTGGEDFYFFTILRKHGVKIYVDQDASKGCGHVGDHEYRLADECFEN